jgi:hypothetical protein
VCGGPVERPTGVAACTDQQVGTPCSPRGATCDPGSGCGQLLLCTETDPTLLGCPISARRYKRNVQYLGDADVRRLHDELLKLRLATYQYKSENAASPDHLGFIIDDVGRSPAVGADGTRVDLYGYASMAVAAIQAQAREIDTLKREVAALRAGGTQTAKPTR